ncbi:MAG: hypothetical protein OXH16_15315 [Gemmatimonadetes bacterium]|nr:hypothetical protein [Gemmatimonadota bacterium]
MKASIPFEDYLMPKLKDPKYADEYIDVALETYDEDQNLDALLFILQSVVRARGEDKKVIEKIYWAFKKRGILPMLKKSSRPRYKYALDYLGLSTQGVAADSSASNQFVVNEASN